jgi:DNA-binding NarL/FixJ family response regulator
MTTPGGDTVRVLIVEDHPMVAEGLARVLAAADDLEVVGTASTVAEGFRRACAEKPDVAVLDQTLPDGRGTELAGRLRNELPELAVVIMSALSEESLVADVVDSDCAGLVSKGKGASELIRAVRAAAAGETFLSADAVRHLAARRAGRHPGSDLTGRESEVLQCLADGLSNEAIGRRLYLSTNTIGNHLQRVMLKLGAHSKLEALVIALRLGIVDPPRPERPGV